MRHARSARRRRWVTARARRGDGIQRRTSSGWLRQVPLLAACGMVGGCGAPSAFMPASVEAGKIADLFVVMASGAAIIWCGVMAFAIHATVLSPRRHDARLANRIIIGGGVVLPVIVLFALLAYGLRLMPELRPPVPQENLRVAVSGEQWWWRVRYRLPGGREVESANAIHLPVGRSTEFLLSSPDVIHSFWVPALGGKVDMTPGRTTRLVVTPTRTGTYRGACAEYCGASHAHMNLLVHVMQPEDFRRWLEKESANAEAARSVAARRGRDAFLRNGCGACHTVRGTAADGRIGPDLTHLAGRLRLAAGTLPNEQGALRRWIEAPRRYKPGVHMPAFGMLPDEDLNAIAAWLGELE